MKRLWILLVLVAACRSSAQIKLEEGLNLAKTYESQGSHSLACSAYEPLYFYTDDPKKRAELIVLHQNAFNMALLELNDYKQSSKWHQLANNGSLLFASSRRFHREIEVKPLVDLANFEIAKNEVETLIKRRHYMAAFQRLKEVSDTASRLGRITEYDELIKKIFEEALTTAKSSESNNKFLDAIKIYEEIMTMDSTKKEAMSSRLYSAKEKQIELVLLEGKQYETQKMWDAALGLYESNLSIASQLSKGPELQGKIDNARIQSGLLKGSAFELQSRFSEALAVYKSLIMTATRTGHSEKIKDSIKNCSVKLFNQVVDQCKIYEKEERYKDIIGLLSSGLEPAREIGMEDELNTRMLKAKRSRYDQAVGEARKLVRLDEYDSALVILNEIKPIANDINESEELKQITEKVRAERFDYLITKAKTLEKQDRFDEAIQVYKSLMSEYPDTKYLTTMIGNAQNSKLDQIISSGRSLEKQGKYYDALKIYESARPLARQLKREYEVERLIEDARYLCYPGSYSVVSRIYLDCTPSHLLFSNCGSYLAVCDPYDRFILYSTQTWKRCYTIENASRIFAFSADDKMIAMATGSCFNVLDTRTGKGLVYCNIKTQITSLYFYQSYVLVGCHDGTIWIYDLTCKKLIESKQVCHGTSITCLSIDPYGTYIAAGTWTGEVILIQIKKLKIIRTFGCGVGHLHNLYFHNDNLVVAGSQSIKTYQIEPVKCVRTVEWKISHACCQSSYFTGYYGQYAYVWEPGREDCHKYSIGKNISCAAYCHHGKYLAYGVDKTIIIVK